MSKEQGMKTVEMNNAEFVSVMRSYAIARAKRVGIVDADYVRSIARKRGLAPKHPNAYGPVFLCSELTCVGYKASIAPSRRGGTIKVWGLSRPTKKANP